MTSPAEAVQAAKTLFGCYRRDDAADPETYAAAVAAVFSTYPPEVVRQVTDPRIGLASRSKFLPSVSEVREACEELVRREARMAARRQQAEAQLKDRKADAERRASHTTTFYDDMLAKYGPDFGINRYADAVRDIIAQAEVETVRPKASIDPNTMFRRACEAQGYDPDGLVSPALAAQIEKRTGKGEP